MTLWVKFDFESTLTFESILTLGQSRLSKINEIKSLNNKDFELSEQIILDFKFPENKIVYQFQGISNFYHFHISYNPRAVEEKRISIVSSVFINDLKTFSFPFRIVEKERNEKMKDGFDDITNDFELKLDKTTFRDSLSRILRQLFSNMPSMAFISISMQSNENNVK
jgi:chloramphenicol O-acetyltransferase